MGRHGRSNNGKQGRDRRRKGRDRHSFTPHEVPSNFSAVFEPMISFRPDVLNAPSIMLSLHCAANPISERLAEWLQRN